MLSIADCCVEVRDSLMISTSSWGLSRGGENISSSNYSVSVKSSANIDSSNSKSSSVLVSRLFMTDNRS